MVLRLVQLVVLAAVAFGVYQAVVWMRGSTEPVATVPGAIVGRADAAADAARLQAAATALEAYRADHGSYAGATVPLLLPYQPTLDPRLRIVRADGNGYCVESGTSSLAGPGGRVRPGGC